MTPIYPTRVSHFLKENSENKLQGQKVKYFECDVNHVSLVKFLYFKDVYL